MDYEGEDLAPLGPVLVPRNQWQRKSYGHGNKIFNKMENKILFCKDKNDWKKISVLMQRTWVDCCFKYHSLLKSSTQIQEWSPEEDNILSRIVKYFELYLIHFFKKF